MQTAKATDATHPSQDDCQLLARNVAAAVSQRRSAGGDQREQRRTPRTLPCPNLLSGSNMRRMADRISSSESTVRICMHIIWRNHDRAAHVLPYSGRQHPERPNLPAGTLQSLCQAHTRTDMRAWVTRTRQRFAGAGVATPQLAYRPIAVYIDLVNLLVFAAELGANDATQGCGSGSHVRTISVSSSSLGS